MKKKDLSIKYIKEFFVNEIQIEEPAKQMNKEIDDSYYYKNYDLMIPKKREDLLSLIKEGYFIRKFIINVEIKDFGLAKQFYLCNKHHTDTQYLLNEQGISPKSYYNETNSSLLNDFFDETSTLSNYIHYFAVNVLRLLKSSKKGYLLTQNKDINERIIWISIEFFLLIITTERFRSNKPLLLIYIEFYKLKHMDNKDKKQLMEKFKQLFNQEDSILKFVEKNGVQKIKQTNYEYVFELFKDMINYTGHTNNHQNEFYQRKFEKLKALFDFEEIHSKSTSQNGDVNLTITIQCKIGLPQIQDSANLNQSTKVDENQILRYKSWKKKEDPTERLQKKSTSTQQSKSTNTQQSNSTNTQQSNSTNTQQNKSTNTQQSNSTNTQQNKSTSVQQNKSTIEYQRKPISAQQNKSTSVQQNKSTSVQQNKSTIEHQRKLTNKHQRKPINAQQNK